MSDFSVKVVEIIEPVENHPNADRLSIIRIGGYLCISAKMEDGSHRYKQGDLVVYVPEGAVVPEYLLNPGFWDEEKGKGILAGSKGNRVKAKRLRDVFSQGILFPVEYDDRGSAILLGEDGTYIFVKNGDNVAEHLNIIKYEPPIPIALSGEVMSIFGHTAKYDFESIQTLPDLFEIGENVIVTEKLHGCLHEDSLVMLPNGEELSIKDVINDINIDTILSYDVENNSFIPRKITGRKNRENTEGKQWVKLTLENGRHITLTEDHPVYSRDRKTWVDAGSIMENEDIESPIL